MGIPTDNAGLYRVHSEGSLTQTQCRSAYLADNKCKANRGPPSTTCSFTVVCMLVLLSTAVTSTSAHSSEDGLSGAESVPKEHTNSLTDLDTGKKIQYSFGSRNGNETNESTSLDHNTFAEVINSTMTPSSRDATTRTVNYSNSEDYTRPVGALHTSGVTSSWINFNATGSEADTTSNIIASSTEATTTLTATNITSTAAATTATNTAGSTNHSYSVTETPTDNNSSNNDTSDITSGLKSTKDCHQMCTCPNYDTLSEFLIPDLRLLMRGALDNYTDNVLKLFLMQQFSTNAEPVRSTLGLLLQVLMSSHRENVALFVQWARLGITNCWLKANDTFYLDAAAEAKLFPQVEFKVAQERAKALQNAQGKDPIKPVDGNIYKASQLFNISFVCKRGGKVIVTKETNLYRYGRWRNINCHVSTEGQLSFDRNMSLIELSVTNGSASWLQNISVLDKGQTRQNLTSVNKGVDETEAGNSNRTAMLNKRTMFPNVREVSFINSTISVQQLSQVLAWFQKATDLTLWINNLGDFKCRQLLPSPAAWTNFSLSHNGLTAIPACLLRPSLISLNLSHNAISDISLIQYPRIVPVPNMDSLDLNDNDISHVGILADMNLTVLYLAGNKISTLNKLSFNRLPQLGLLDLSRNRLHRLDPGSFKSLVYLMYLDLRHNQLQHFDKSLSPMRVGPSLVCNIYLQNNRFSHPPFQTDDYAPGDQIIVHSAGNPFACDCNMTAYVQATKNTSQAPNYADRSALQCKLPASMAGVPLDAVAYNVTCPVVARCPVVCACDLSEDEGVVTVNCSAAESLQQPDVLPSSYPLRLELQGGSGKRDVASLKDTGYWDRVLSLNVSGRGLSRLSEFLCEALPRARLVDVSHNNLKRLPQCYHSRPQHWPSLELRLAHNPWSCDCQAVSLVSWLAHMRDGKERQGVRVADAEQVFCSVDTAPGIRVADWDSSHCRLADYLPWVVTLATVLGLSLTLGPLLYVYRLQAMVTIHAHLHVRPFTRTHAYKEEDYDYEALVLHGSSDTATSWVVNSLIPRIQNRHHRLCIPDRDFVPGSSLADSYASAVGRSKSTVCVVSADCADDEWWLYAFQLARAQNARLPDASLLLVLLERVEEVELSEEARDFLKTNTYLSIDDGGFWNKLLYYLPDPPKAGIRI